MADDRPMRMRAEKLERCPLVAHRGAEEGTRSRSGPGRRGTRMRRPEPYGTGACMHTHATPHTDV